MVKDRDYWALRCHLSGNALAKLEGRDPGHVREDIRKATELYPDLPWYSHPNKVTNEQKVQESLRKGIAVFDIHTPKENKALMRNIFRFAKDFQPDIFVLGGDNMNMDAVDHWLIDGKKVGALEGKRVKKDYQYFRENIHEPLMEVLPPDCEKVWMLGNHEKWIDLAISKNPNGEGYWAIENNLPLVEDGWLVFDYGELYTVGKLSFMHGEYTNKYNAEKTVNVYGTSIVYGHGHSYQVYTKTTPHNHQSHSGIQIPCACDLNPHNRLNKPNAWLNGFAVFYVQPNGFWNLYPVIAFDGSFVSPDGTFYE